MVAFPFNHLLLHASINIPHRLHFKSSHDYSWCIVRAAQFCRPGFCELQAVLAKEPEGKCIKVDVRPSPKFAL